MALSTFNALNRCLPQMSYNKSVSSFCEYPKCTQAAEPCVDGFERYGLSDVWEMTAPSHARKCQREVSLLVDSTTTVGLRHPLTSAASGFGSLPG